MGQPIKALANGILTERDSDFELGAVNIPSTVIDLAQARLYFAVLTGNITFTFTNGTSVVDKTIEIALTNSSGGNATATFPTGASGVHWAGGTIPTAITTLLTQVVTLKIVNGKILGTFSTNHASV